MLSLSLLLARPLRENPTGTELGGGYSFSSQGTALFFFFFSGTYISCRFVLFFRGIGCCNGKARPRL